MNFVVIEKNRVWEDREGIGHDLQDRAGSFSEDAHLIDVWEWIKSDKTGEPRGNIQIIPEGK